jgi:hypothetical protein
VARETAVKVQALQIEMIIVKEHLETSLVKTDDNETNRA